jgi:hypothetical protein
MFALPLALPLVGLMFRSKERTALRDEDFDAAVERNRAVSADAESAAAAAEGPAEGAGIEVVQQPGLPIKDRVVNEEQVHRFDPRGGRPTVPQMLPGFMDSGDQFGTPLSQAFAPLDRTGQGLVGGQGYDAVDAMASGNGPSARAGAGYVGKPLRAVRHGGDIGVQRPPKQVVLHEEMYGEVEPDRQAPWERAAYSRAKAAEAQGAPPRFVGQRVPRRPKEGQEFAGGDEMTWQRSRGYHPTFRPGLVHETQTLRGLGGPASMTEYKRVVAHARPVTTYYPDMGTNMTMVPEEGAIPQGLRRDSEFTDRFSVLTEAGVGTQSRTVDGRQPVALQHSLARDVRADYTDMRVPRVTPMYEVGRDHANRSDWSVYQRPQFLGPRATAKLQSDEVGILTGGARGPSQGQEGTRTTTGLSYEELRQKAIAPILASGPEGGANAQMNQHAEFMAGEQGRAQGVAQDATLQSRRVNVFEPTSERGVGVKGAMTYGGGMDHESAMNRKRQAVQPSGERLDADTNTASLASNRLVPRGVAPQTGDMVVAGPLKPQPPAAEAPMGGEPVE